MYYSKCDPGDANITKTSMIKMYEFKLKNVDICYIIIIENTVDLILTCPLDYLRPYLRDDFERLNS